MYIKVRKTVYIPYLKINYLPALRWATTVSQRQLYQVKCQTNTDFSAQVIMTVDIAYFPES